MARVDTALPPRVFSLCNDSENPSLLYWKLANTAEWDTYERKTFEIFGVQSKGQKPTAEQVKKGAELTREFVFSRIVSASGFEVDDGAGGSKSLKWPDDKAMILSVLTGNSDLVGAVDLFVRTVISAHRPADQSALQSQASGN